MSFVAVHIDSAFVTQEKKLSDACVCCMKRCHSLDKRRWSACITALGAARLGLWCADHHLRLGYDSITHLRDPGPAAGLRVSPIFGSRSRSPFWWIDPIAPQFLPSWMALSSYFPLPKTLHFSKCILRIVKWRDWQGIEAAKQTIEFPAAPFFFLAEKKSKKWIKLLPKTIGNRKRDCAWGCAWGINTTWENLQIEKHKSGRRSFRSPNWFVLFDLQVFSGGVYSPSATSRTISFSTSNSFWYLIYVGLKFWIFSVFVLNGWWTPLTRTYKLAHSFFLQFCSFLLFCFLLKSKLQSHFVVVSWIVEYSGGETSTLCRPEVSASPCA